MELDISRRKSPGIRPSELDSEPTGIVMPGTESPLNFGYFTETGIYSVTGYTDFCSAFMVGQIYIYETPAPEQASTPNGPETGCDGQSATYTTLLLEDADVYIWTLNPEEAGVLTPVFETAHITWNPGFTGNASLSVHGENLCGEGPESEPLEITVSVTPTPEILGLELVCDNLAEKYETADYIGSFYSWEVTGGVIVDGAGTYQVTVLWGDPGEGSVNVTETSAGGCSANAETLNVTIEICESVEEISSRNIRIYPNSASDLINMVINNNTDDPVKKILITNSFGQIITVIEITAETSSESINIAGHPAGVYFVRAISNGKVLIVKFMKH